MTNDVIQNFEAITGLVNCSTTKIVTIKFQDFIWSDFQSHLNNQIQGAVSLVRSVMPLMGKRRYERIVSIKTQYVSAPESNYGS
jgi:short-subunit dehydrogenase